MDVAFAWVAVAVVMFCLMGLGRLAVGPASQALPGALWWGWGLSSLLLTLYVTVAPLPLTPLLICLAGFSLLGYALNCPDFLGGCLV
jgi:hypothetical protein